MISFKAQFTNFHYNFIIFTKKLQIIILNHLKQGDFAFRLEIFTPKKSIDWYEVSVFL